jgi:hypothetical protein
MGLDMQKVAQKTIKLVSAQLTRFELENTLN